MAEMMVKRELFGESADQGEKKRGKKEVDPVMLMKYGEIRRKDKGVPIKCDCNAAVVIATSQSPTRSSDRYFSCPYEISDGPGQGCGFKRWWEEALLDEFAKIKEEKKELEECLEKAHDRIDSQEVYIVEMHSQYQEVMADRKQLDDYGGEMYETQMGLAKANDKHDGLERRFDVLEKKCERLNKFL